MNTEKPSTNSSNNQTDDLRLSVTAQQAADLQRWVNDVLGFMGRMVWRSQNGMPAFHLSAEVAQALIDEFGEIFSEGVDK